MDVLSNCRRNVHGRKRRRRIENLSAEQRALYGLQLLEGTARPTAAQVAAVVHLSVPYIYAAQRATPMERYGMERGWLSLSALHNAPRRRRPSDAVIKRGIKRYGPDNVLRILDEMTAPQPMLEAAE
jgi:hypothetical protein